MHLSQLSMYQVKQNLTVSSWQPLGVVPFGLSSRILRGIFVMSWWAIQRTKHLAGDRRISQSRASRWPRVQGPFSTFSGPSAPGRQPQGTVQSKMRMIRRGTSLKESTWLQANKPLLLQFALVVSHFFIFLTGPTATPEFYVCVCLYAYGLPLPHLRQIPRAVL